MQMVAGRTIEIKPPKLNVSSGIRLSLTFGVNHEFDSNVIYESDLQYEKHLDPSISTLFGIMID
jgi:hypothetical protein